MHYSNSEANAAAERELDNDLDHYFEDGEEGAQTDQEFVVSVDIRLLAYDKDDAKAKALKLVKTGKEVSAEVIECLSEDEI
jgi:hypothetical protein